MFKFDDISINLSLMYIYHNLYQKLSLREQNDFGIRFDELDWRLGYIDVFEYNYVLISSIFSSQCK
jgi:hypothetical protein